MFLKRQFIESVNSNISRSCFWIALRIALCEVELMPPCLSHLSWFHGPLRQEEVPDSSKSDQGFVSTAQRISQENGQQVSKPATS